MEKEATQLEKDHVHVVYEKIAPYFNDTRYKAWPRVRQFILDQEPGSVIADIGCGNGKYLNINKEAFKIGCDYCLPLVQLARNQGHEVMVCDSLRLPYRDECFDAILSIGVIHHFSTKERRIRAVKEMARTLRIGGQVMICVWAMEQKRRKFEKQDIFVPWNPSPPALRPSANHIPHKSKKSKKHKIIDSCQMLEGVEGTREAHRKARSTSSVEEEEGEGTLYTSFEKSLRLWLFSRSLDSVFDVGDDSTLQSQKELNRFQHFESPLNERGTEQSRTGLVKQLSDLFTYRQNSEDDVFQFSTVQDPPKQFELSPPCSYMLGNRSEKTCSSRPLQPTAVLHSCSKVSLPDLVSHQDSAVDEQVFHDDAQSALNFREQRSNQSFSTSSINTRTEPDISTKNKQQQLVNTDPACLRYYHVFREGELAELLEKYLDNLHIIQTYFDHENWCVIAEKVQVWKI
ncbi:probable tRNA methyltransferase 9B [Protopterus annectens]|uniref:probable tRNA methyltransferase 9B n=1 Tax=Protopterus annectens TaxID=7888 RepID=UPI001CFB47E6|nr:probable tRNA methyltransferase 9B [Protopterus annectens]XP_043929159.1 probable tRNA methyltransferase 9B [Protopterus annectens]